MRAVIIGAGAITQATAEVLLKRGHEVVIIELSKERIEELSQQLDCGMIHGDGSKPGILKEANPKATHLLFCLTGNDHVNIIAGLVGQSLGYARVVVKIEEAQFEHICIELGLTDTIVPAQTTGRYLADMFEGQDLLELSAMIKDEARVFSFVLPKGKALAVNELGLPDESRVMCLYRDNKFMLADHETRLRPGDEVVVVTHSKNLPKLREQWGAKARRKEKGEAGGGS